MADRLLVLACLIAACVWRALFGFLCFTLFMIQANLQWREARGLD
jgi:hypothetical protein